MKFGFHEINITPARPHKLSGLGDRRMSTGVKTPIYLKAAAIEDDNKNRLFIITMDLLGMLADKTSVIKKLALQQLNINPESLIINFSHTHSAPSVYDHPSVPAWGVENEYTEFLITASLEALKLAISNLHEARIKYFRAQSDFGVNRRLPTEQGTRGGANINGYYEKDLFIFQIFDAHNKLDTIIYSYSCHPANSSGYQFIGMEHERFVICADYPGAVNEELKRFYGQHVNTMFIQGAGGSCNPRFYDDNNKFINPDIKLLGEKLSEDIKKSMENDKYQQLKLNLSIAEKQIFLKIDKSKIPTKEQLEILVEKRKDFKGNFKRPECLLEILNRGDEFKTEYPMWIRIIRLTENLQFFTMSGEVTVEMGRFVKDLFPKTTTIFFGYCFNVDLYIPTKEMIDNEGGYEVTGDLFDYPAPFDSSIEDIITQGIKELNLKG